MRHRSGIRSPISDSRCRCGAVCPWDDTVMPRFPSLSADSHRSAFGWRARLILSVVLLMVILPRHAGAQDSDVTDEPAIVDNTSDWNEFDFGFTTFRFGAAFIHEYAAYSQNETAK